MKKLYSKTLMLSLAAMLMIMSLQSFAQALRVSGTVKDDTGQGVPGASILEKGTGNGTVADADGKFTLNVSQSNATIQISFIGFKTVEVAVNGQSSIDIALVTEVTSLEEVVVTGYSIDKRRELTGAVSTVKSKDIVFAPSGNVEQMLQGRVAGVTVITNGQPGTSSQIRVRGFGAFGGNQPLYIVDGVPTQDVSFINPDDVESITVLKDAASASIYGARAASGVIVYTTKRGKRGQKLNVTYDNLYGVTNPGTGQDMMNPTDFADWTWNAQKNTATQNGDTDPTHAAALAKFNHPQFGGGLTPVIPNYLSVGGTPGVSAPVDLAAEKLKYNVDPRNGSIYQVIAANKSGTDWYSAITRNASVIVE